MASRRIPLVLEGDFEGSQACGQKADLERGSGSIFQMMAENPSWGAPRIHGELLMLGFEVSERTISRWMKRATTNPDPTKRWLTFLRNHREAIAAMDFARCRRSPSPCSIASSSLATIAGVFCTATSRGIPRACGLCSKLREAFPFDSAPRFLIFDRDAKYGLEVAAVVRSLNLCPVRTSFESPWQNGIAERWVGSCRRDLLDHVIAFNERHLKRLLCEYISYHHEDRTHLGLGKGTPARRICSANAGRVISHDRLGRLHHRYHPAA